MRDKIIITIDGTSSTGKSTIAKRIAKKLDYIYMLVKRHGLKVSEISENEFRENSFVFCGPEGASWQIIERRNDPKNIPKIKSPIIYPHFYYLLYGVDFQVSGPPAFDAAKLSQRA